MQVAARTGAWHGKKLPYIQSTGTQWIDPHIIMNYGDRIETDFIMDQWNAADGYAGGYILGAYIDTRAYMCGWYDWGEPIGCAPLVTFGDDSQLKEAIGGMIDRSIVGKMIHFVATAEIDKEIRVSINSVVRSFVSTQQENAKPMAMFARALARSGNGVSSVTNLSKVKLFGLKYYKAGELVRDFVPVDGETPCLFDNVSGEYFLNRGGGKFVYGEISANGGGGIAANA